MALLTRYLHLSDTEDTHVFNFVVTKSVTRDLSRDVVSKDFAYGSHRWALAFSRQEKVTYSGFSPRVLRNCKKNKTEKHSVQDREVEHFSIHIDSSDTF